MSILTRRTFTTALASSAMIGMASGSASGQPPATVANATGTGTFVLPPLPYAADALEPVIDAQTMLLHHDKHHAAYVNNVNEAVQAAPEIAGKPVEYLLSHLDEIPESVRTKVRNNLGGHVNHSMFWQIMDKKGGSPEGAVQEAINRDFGGFEKLKEDFNGAGTRVFGSGWVFVLVDSHGKLTLETRPNQDSPLIDGKRALFGNDVWEHAYYLKHQNRRADYLKSWWEVVNWQKISERYAAARNGTLII